MEGKAKAGIQTMSAWPHPHNVVSQTVFKRPSSKRLPTIEDAIAGQDRIEAGHKVFSARRCRHQTACYRRGAPSVIHDIESPCREASTPSGMIRASLVHDFAKYLTDGATEAAMEVVQRSIGCGIVSLQCLTHRLCQTGHAPVLPVAASSGSSK